MGRLEASGRLDRAIEFLPGEATLHERRQAGIGLTRPELAVLLSYAKLALHDELIESSVPDDSFLSRELERYFPIELREKFPDAVAIAAVTGRAEIMDAPHPGGLGDTMAAIRSASPPAMRCSI
jgi:NAD-specific glutamate dehydrogenase